MIKTTNMKKVLFLLVSVLFEFSEKQISGRTVKLMIDYEDVLNADTFVE